MKIVKCVSRINEFDPQLFMELGIGVEIQDFAKSNIYVQPYEELISTYQGLLKDFSGITGIHGPFIDLRPMSPDIEVRAITFAKYQKALRVAKALNVDYCLFHSQLNPWINLHQNQAYLDAYKNFWLDLLSSVDYKGKIVIENVFEDHPSQTKSLVDAFGMDNFYICLDTGHSRIRNDVALETWLKALNDKLWLVHMNWNDTTKDAHDPIPDEAIMKIKNTIDLKERVLAIEYSVPDLKAEVMRIRQLLNV